MKPFPDGFRHLPAFLDTAAQRALVDDIRAVVQAAPLYTPQMPRSGTPMSVRMTNCGALGWVADKMRGYRYQPTHPDTGAPWPAIPEPLLAIWREVSGVGFDPETCLVNFYDSSAKMGLHQDRDEQELGAPVVSVSLGDTCLFRVGGILRNAPTQSFRLNSGDVVVLGGAARMAFHGVDRIYPGTSPLLKSGGRINLTLRRVTPTYVC